MLLATSCRALHAPKANLSCNLLREAGFHDATIVTVPIPGNGLHHLGVDESSPYPNRLQPCFTKVSVEGVASVDSICT
jgi:hypothetical protein